MTFLYIMNDMKNSNKYINLFFNYVKAWNTYDFKFF